MSSLVEFSVLACMTKVCITDRAVYWACAGKNKIRQLAMWFVVHIYIFANYAKFTSNNICSV